MATAPSHRPDLSKIPHILEAPDEQAFHNLDTVLAKPVLRGSIDIDWQPEDPEYQPAVAVQDAAEQAYAKHLYHGHEFERSIRDMEKNREAIKAWDHEQALLPVGPLEHKVPPYEVSRLLRHIGIKGFGWLQNALDYYGEEPAQETSQTDIPSYLLPGLRRALNMADYHERYYFSEPEATMTEEDGSDGYLPLKYLPPLPHEMLDGVVPSILVAPPVSEDIIDEIADLYIASDEVARKKEIAENKLRLINLLAAPEMPDESLLDLTA